MSKRVYQYTKAGNLIASFPSTCEAQRQTGVLKTGISKCCNLERNHAGGFVWSYQDKLESVICKK